jgi:hypothetical protein
MVQFLDRHGLELIDIERVPIQHGSIIGTVQLKGARKPVKKSVFEFLELEAKRRLGEVETLREFAAKVQGLRQQTSSLVRKWKTSKASIAGFGAARSGPMLISQLGLAGAIEYIVDDHPQKVNRYSSGDGIPIVPTTELCRRMPDYTVILAWVHADKIIDSNREYLNRGGNFVVLSPETRVVGKSGNIPISSFG